MSDTAARPVLARIIEAHEGRGPGRPDPSPALERALTRAIRRAAIPFDGLSPVVEEASVARDVDLKSVEGGLPEHGLIAALEDDAGRRGMLTLEHSLVDALIEVQTTGKVEENSLPPRTVTRIDEALSRDFLDLLLGGFAKECADLNGRDWPLRMSYGSKVADVRQLNLLFPEKGYHVLSAKVRVGAGRTGHIALVLPVDPVLARQAAAKARASRQLPTKPEDWPEKMLHAVSSAPMTLDAVLMRMTLSLGKVQGLSVGDEIPFDREMLEGVTLEDDETRIIGRGNLGQLHGRRAVRIVMGEAAVLGKGAAPAPASSPMMAAAGSGGPQALAGGFDPNAPMGDLDPNAPMGGDNVGEGMPMAGFDPDAPMGGVDPNAPMGGDDSGAGVPMAGFDPDAPMGDFDPNAPMGGL